MPYPSPQKLVLNARICRLPSKVCDCVCVPSRYIHIMALQNSVWRCARVHVCYARQATGPAAAATVRHASLCWGSTSTRLLLVRHLQPDRPSYYPYIWTPARSDLAAANANGGAVAISSLVHPASLDRARKGVVRVEVRVPVPSTRAVGSVLAKY